MRSGILISAGEITPFISSTSIQLVAVTCNGLTAGTRYLWELNAVLKALLLTHEIVVVDVVCPGFNSDVISNQHPRRVNETMIIMCSICSVSFCKLSKEVGS